jgi:hypothetical protein
LTPTYERKMSMSSTTATAKPRSQRPPPTSDEVAVRRIVTTLVCTPLRSNENVRSVQLSREGGEWSLWVFVADTSRAAYEPLMKALLDMQTALHREVPGVLMGQHIHAEKHATDSPDHLVLLRR